MNACKKIDINLYGGEVLLAKEKVIYFMDKISEFAKSKKIEIVNSITTNGTLIDQGVIDKLFKPHNMRIQITIDGLKEVHDKRRCYMDGSGTFQKIIKNLNLLKSNKLLDRVTIRINVDKENIGKMTPLLDVLRKLSIKEVYFGAVNFHRPAIPAILGYESKCIPLSKAFHTFDAYGLRDALTRRGWGGNCCFGKRGPCPFVGDRCYVVDQNLDVFKCEAGIGDHNFKVGVIKRDGNMEILPEYYKEMNRSPFNFKKCRACKLLPFCAGGCAVRGFYKNGTYNKPYCSKLENEKYLRKEIVNFVNSRIGKKENKKGIADYF